MIYKEYKNDTYNIYTIKTKKYRSARIEIIFRDNIIKEDLCKRSFLSQILCESSKKYNNKKEITLECERLYNASIIPFNTVVGNQTHFGLQLSFLDPSFTDKRTLLNNINLLFELLLNPDVEENGFNERSFSIVKSQMKNDINSITEYSESYAMQRALETMDEDFPGSYRLKGTLEDLELITKENLYDYYKKVMQTNYCDIYIAGNLDMDYVSKLIINKFNLNVIKNHRLDLYINPTSKKKITIKEEQLAFNQTQLVLIYNIEKANDIEKDITLRLIDIILGSGGIETKLSSSLRQDNSLCYSSSSMYSKYSGYIVVTSGIDYSKKDLAIKLVKKCVKDIQNGIITDKELLSAKNILSERIKINSDGIYNIMMNYLFKNIASLKSDEERISIINSIKKEDIIKCSKKIYLNTIYILKSGDKK